MKRIKSACLQQTIHFMLKDDTPKNLAIRAVDDEIAQYKFQMERSNTKFQVIEEKRLEDGSVMMKIKKQYNQYNCDGYMD